MTERMKPPARRTGGRPLGGSRETTPPPPPPAAELTPEQFAAEQAVAQREGRPAADEQQVQSAPSTVPAEETAQGLTEAVSEAAQVPAQSAVAVAPRGAVEAPVAGQPARLAGADAEMPAQSDAEPVELQAQAVGPAEERTESAAQPAHPVAHALQHGSPRFTPVADGVASATEVAVRPTDPAGSGGTAFPVRPDVPAAHWNQGARSEATPSEGTPWAPGPGRPKDIPKAAVVLNQRIITRESLDSSVPAALKLKKRIKRFALDNELDHLPIGDIVSVALDEWLTVRGF